jgi:3-dehydroquinate synthase
VKSIYATDYYIHFQQNSFIKLNDYLAQNNLSKVIILVDENTKKDCLPYFLSKLDTTIKLEFIEIKAGEIHKNIDTCVEVWKALTELNTDRKSVLINLGGGMVTDLGGFVASTFKRGIKFINIPTTLLSMVDASVGSKTGVDLGTLKNLVGLFSNPEMVIIDTTFLATVSKRELHSGLAEIIKYGLTYDVKLWNEIKNSSALFENNLDALIYRSVEIKNEVVTEDPKENGLRKILNFGHTIGHAIESYFLESSKKETLTHGEAIAAGMVIEGYFSHKLFNFPKEELEIIKTKISNFYGKAPILAEDYEAIIDLMRYDKKNIGTTVNFVLLEDLANYKIDTTVSHQLLIEGLDYYNNRI